MTVSMTWPQYRRCACTVGEWETHIAGRSAAEVLLLLLLRRGHIVSVVEFIEWLWPNPDNEPEFAYDLIHRYMMNLRRSIGTEIVDTHHGRGYSICR